MGFSLDDYVLLHDIRSTALPAFEWSVYIIVL